MYDGGSSRAPLLESFSGSALPAAVSATSADGLLIVFMADNSLQRSGFVASYRLLYDNEARVWPGGVTRVHGRMGH